MRGVLQPPASIVSVVEPPRAVNSEARPMRPECPVIRRYRGGGGGCDAPRDGLAVEAAEHGCRGVRTQP